MSKQQNIFQKNWSAIRFIVTFISLYLFLYFFNLFYIGITSPGGIYIRFLDEHLNYIHWWRSFSIEATASIIRWFGYKVATSATHLHVSGRSGFILVYECLAYGVMSAFIGFVIAFPKELKSKIIFLFIGLLFIQTLNILRFILLSLYWKHQKLIFNLDHHDLFNLCIYLLLMVICYIWINLPAKYGTDRT